jgi:hypothetical protein
MDDRQKFEHVRAAKRRHEDKLLALPGVHAVGVGYKEVRGKPTDELAVVVLVSAKPGAARLLPTNAVPSELTITSPFDGRKVTVPTDVRVEEPLIEAAHLTQADLIALASRLRPSPGGVLIASNGAGGGSGTLGGWAVDDASGRQVFISNQHVLGSTVGALVMQPLFGGPATDQFGTVLRTSSNFDATIGVPFTTADIRDEIYGNGSAIFEIGPATIGMDVEKTGVRTGHTEGRVDLLDVTTTSPCVRSTSAFRVVATNPSVFGQVGDSGSLIMERNAPAGQTWKRAVGLLYCITTDGTRGFGHEITEVFADLRLITLCEAIGQIIDDLLESIRFGRAARTSGHRGFARDVQKRLGAGRIGRQVVEAVGIHRAAVVKVLLDGDGRRAFEAALAPLLEKVVITDELLDLKVGADDVKRFERLFKVAERIAPDAKDAIEQARSTLKGMRGRSIGSVLLADQG